MTIEVCLNLKSLWLFCEHNIIPKIRDRVNTILFAIGVLINSPNNNSNNIKKIIYVFEECRKKLITHFTSYLRLLKLVVQKQAQERENLDIILI